METTRHFVTAVYVVHDNAVALHDHKRLDMWLPAGGHIDRDELPHEAAVREVKEEMGIDVNIHRETSDHESEFARGLPEPEHLMLEDIDRVGDRVAHQHIDLVYYASAGTADIEPSGDDEVSADDWSWCTKNDVDDLLENGHVTEDTAAIAKEAIETIDG